MPSCYHVVAFKLKPEMGETEKTELRERFLSMGTGCLQNEKPYIVSIKGGNQTSKEFMAQGMDLVFVMEFASEADRTYYHKQDTYHREFIPTCISYTAAGFGLDFTD
ncbi:hypothetical protein SBRCBS47491_006598 [Sporothrix bragantina]|uniref:Stress-response A/B barrel domain-containing protein n=1 Tax=Sporothrix bragantina TaxID=671064 RepID=A0ABP0C799_9PEZI